MSNKTSLFIRVTQIYQCDEKLLSFSGVPIEKGNYNGDRKRIVFINVKNSLVPLEPQIGQHWKVEGDSEDKVGNYNKLHRYYENPESLYFVMPDDEEGFVWLLDREPSFKGISADTARSIWGDFGNNIYKHVYDKNEELLSKKLSNTKVKKLIDGFKKYSNLKYAQWLVEIGIPIPIQQRLLKYHGKETFEQINNNPYVLSIFDLDFSTVDHIAKEKFNIAIDDDRRLTAAFHHAIQQHEKSGHTVASKSNLTRRLEVLLKSSTLVSKAFECVQKQSYKKVVIFNREQKTYQASASYVKEKSIALRVKYLTEWEPSELEKAKFKIAFRYALKTLPFKLSLGQVRAIYKALKSKICIVSGGAGTGKTSVLKAILAGYKVLNILPHCAALSGRAAKRMFESTGYKSTTIARLLHDKPIEPNLLSHEKENVLIIDEASMLDVSTMFKLINHINPDTRILLVGDPNQLPPIDPGLILNDLIYSRRVTNCKLDAVKRQEESSGIPEYSSLIAKGIIPSKLSYGNVHFHCVEIEQINKLCVELYELQPKGSQIVSPAYTPEIGGINILNELCQKAINLDSDNLRYPFLDQYVNSPLKINDPVIFTKNNFELDVQNGTVGKLITQADGRHLGEVLLADSNQKIKLNHDIIKTVELAYCMSLHKAQGSQFERMIVPVIDSVGVDKNWLYTAITRAEKEVHLVGPKSFFEKAMRKKGATDKRKTGLRYILNSLF